MSWWLLVGVAIALIVARENARLERERRQRDIEVAENVRLLRQNMETFERDLHRLEGDR